MQFRCHSVRPGAWHSFIWIFIFGAATAFLGASEQPWQLRLTYEDNGALSLKDASPFPHQKKKLTHPGAEGSLYHIPIRIEWLDAGDEPLAESLTHLPLGRRISPAATRDLPGYLPEKSAVVLRIHGPAQDAGARKIRITDLRDFNLVVQQFPRLAPVQVLELDAPGPFSAAGSRPSAPPTLNDINTVQSTGSDANRVVFVVLGDGYIQQDLDDGTFDQDVGTVMDQFQNYPPWDNLLPATNIYSVDVLSNERGADLEDGPPGSGTEKDTYFDSTFYSFQNIERNLGVPFSVEDEILDLADDLFGVGVWDQVILIVNSEKYGGSGGPVATNSMNEFGPDISIHEIGHSFADLGDEYDTPGVTYPLSSFDVITFEPNVDTNGANPKWSHWIEESTPLPTPDTSQYDGVVGAFEGAYYAEFGAFRPVRSCMMRDLGSDFCPVCKEVILLEFLDRVDFVDGTFPDSKVLSADSETATVSIQRLPISGLSAGWRVNDVPVTPDQGSNSVTIAPASFEDSSVEVTVSVIYNDSDLRLDSPEQRITFTINNTGTTSLDTPRWWLASNGFDTADGSDAIDHDSDGVPTYLEFVDETDPKDKTSFAPASQTSIPAPQNVSATDGSPLDRVIIEWDPAPGATAYRVYRGTTTDFQAASPFPVDLPDTLLTDSTAVAGTIYYYWVIAFGESAQSEPSEPDTGFIPTEYAISALADNPAEGSVTGGGTYSTGQQVSLEASPGDGFFLVGWEENGRQVSTANPFTFTAAAERSLTAVFEAIPPGTGPTSGLIASDGTFTDRILVDWDASVSAQSYKVYRGTDSTFENASFLFSLDTPGFTDQLAQPGIIYTYWIVEVGPQGDSDPSLPETGFILTTFEVSASASPAEGGSVSGSGSFASGETVSLTATPAEGYRLDSWTVNGVNFVDDLVYAFIPSADTDVTANFVRDKVFIDDSPEGTPPSIIRSSLSGAVWEGSDTRLFVSVEGSAPLTFAWTRDGSPIPAETGQQLIFENVQTSDSGLYQVTVSNAFGSASTEGALQILPLPEDPAFDLFDAPVRIADIPGQDWVFTTWLGLILTNEFPWIFHPDYGWMFVQVDGASKDEFYAYHPDLGWLWFSKRTFIDGMRYFWRFDSDSFLWFYEVDDEQGVAWYYQFSTGTWIAIPL